MKTIRSSPLTTFITVFYVLVLSPLVLVSNGNNALDRAYGEPQNNVEESSLEFPEEENEVKEKDTELIYTNEIHISPKESNRSVVENDTNGTSSLEDEYDYDYNISDSHSTFNWNELVPTLFVYGATMVIGIAGNSLIIFTICRYRRMKSTTNVFLASLASADLLLITICIPVKVAKLFSYSWSMGFFLCKSVHYLQNVSAICSVLTLTAMSIERYYAIVHPMKAKYICTISQARKIIMGIWIISFFLALPNLFSQEHALVGVRYKAYYCVMTMDRPALWRFHELYMLLLILAIPACIMVIAYGSISWEIWHVMQKRYDMTSGQALNSAGRTESFYVTTPRNEFQCNHRSNSAGERESVPLRYSKRLNRRTNSNVGSFRESIKNANAIRTEEENNTVKQVIKMLVAIVLLFILCWAPLLILNVLYAYDVVSKYQNGDSKNIQSAFTVMAYSNSCINPLVYGFMSKNFRDSFKKALCRFCYRGGRVPRRHLSMSQTRTTSVRYADSSFGRSVSISTTPY